MIIIGEKINSTRGAVRAAIERRDAGPLAALAQKQREAGADYIDVNAGMFLDGEAESLEWLVGVAQDATDAPLSLDSPNATALRRGLRAVRAGRNGKPLINSITDEKARYDAVLPLIKEFDTSVIALCMDDSGMPERAEDRIIIAERLIEKLTGEGMRPEDIFIDPMVRPIGTGSGYGIAALETIREVKRRRPEVHIACGLSNVSYGIPARKLMNRTFLVAAIAAGMDGAILDPLDRELMASLYAGEALLGIDEYCAGYLSKFREGALDV
ncbi:MAG: methyltetrahydrofolate cobalamin methyltransferase [Clostridiales bacterium]|jgi:5-methyltetrahydrofolate--homocysteine methyltransferase|nr:methyltetrahydrofolate cobalamin methyltransferase [Clostridiales bacterium]